MSLVLRASPCSFEAPPLGSGASYTFLIFPLPTLALLLLVNRPSSIELPLGLIDRPEA